MSDTQNSISIMKLGFVDSMIQVKEWDILIGLILEKMFAEPSNPIMPRFLSQISKHLLDNAQVVFKHLFIFMFGKSK